VRRRIASGGGAGVALALALGCAVSPAVSQQTVEESILAPLASRSLLLDGAVAGGLMVAVGERGHVLVNHDQGRTWEQKQVPTSATLTAVYLHDESLGWAVGHDAVILKTEDGGETWRRVHYAPDEERPLLDVWFRDDRNGFAIGAYGFFLTTEDGGETWTDRAFEAEGEVEVDEFYGGGLDYHLNHLAPAEGKRLFIAAEAGMAYRSEDAGASWIILPSPYEGSFFGNLPLGGDSLLLFGLRGHLFRSDDAGETWAEIDTSTTAMLTDGIRLADGTVIVAGLSGTVLVSRDGGATFTLTQREDRLGVSSVLETGDGGLVLVGEGGVRRIEVP
jgi:photosystem II stability/assembly factor-like uncharacterized protein